MAACITNCTDAAAAATDRAAALRHIRHTHTHTPTHNKCPCARCAAAAYFGTFLFACQPPTRLLSPLYPLATTLTIALCAVCYFYRGDIYATCSHLIHAPLDMIHVQPNILIMRTDVARSQ